MISRGALVLLSVLVSACGALERPLEYCVPLPDFGATCALEQHECSPTLPCCGELRCRQVVPPLPDGRGICSP